MARTLRLESAMLQPRPWMRALLVAVAVAGLGAGTTVPEVALAQATADRSMSVPISPNAPERYVVQKGDTLWDISGMYLKDPWFWPEIWHVNPSIQNPHLIYPGDVLYFSYVDGKPRVSLEASSAMRLSPEVRTSPLTGAIRAIPYDLLMDFVGRPSLLTKEDIRNQPYVIGMRDRHIVGSTANEVYARGLNQPAEGTRYNIVGVGEKLHDPDNGDLLGYIGHYAGTAAVIQSTGAVAPGTDSILNMKREEPITHMRVVEVGREILQGDKVFPVQAEVGADFVPSPPANEAILGQIIAVVDGVQVAGKYQVVAINRGTIEKLRRLPSLSRKSTYWPARYCSRSFAGSLSFTTATSGAGLSIASTRTGSRLIGMSPARRTSRTLIARSVFGLAQQNSASPARFSSSVSVVAWCCP